MTLKQEWLTFEFCIPQSVSPLHRIQMKRAFYSGASTAFAMMGEINLDPEKDERQVEIKIQALEDEVKEFIFQECTNYN